MKKKAQLIKLYKKYSIEQIKLCLEKAKKDNDKKNIQLFEELLEKEKKR